MTLRKMADRCRRRKAARGNQRVAEGKNVIEALVTRVAMLALLMVGLSSERSLGGSPLTTRSTDVDFADWKVLSVRMDGASLPMSSGPGKPER